MSRASPDYDRHSLRPTVVHVGPGVFHRAHQAVYNDDLLRSGATVGAIWAVSLRSADVHDALARDDFCYPLIERTSDGSADRRVVESVRTVGSILGITVAARECDRALARLVDPEVTVVTISVSEKGYCAVEPGGALDLTRPEIVHDLTDPTTPRSLPGLLLEALHRRRSSGAEPFTIVSCDNLPSNGKAVARVVGELAEHRDPAFGTWVAGNVAFPSSMVDRMVPTTTEADREWCRTHGLSDAWPVVTEPFSQWVLEDVFPTGRPDWGHVGVELVSDVSLHERAKLRILNAAHSALAYWGALAGHEFIWQAAHDAVLRAATVDLVEHEVIPTLETPHGWDLQRYADEVISRFGNRALPYATAKVAGDGSQKLPVRLMQTATAPATANRPRHRTAQVLAAWLAVMVGPASSALAVEDTSLEHGPGAEIIRRRRSGFLMVDEAIQLLWVVPGFLSSTRPGDRAMSDAVAVAAEQFWHRDPRSVLAATVEPSPAEPPPRYPSPTRQDTSA